MKRMIWLAAVMTAGVFATGCGTGFPNGLIYTELNVPIVVNSSDKDEIKDYKMVETSGSKWFGLFVYGNLDYKDMMKKSGGFSRIQRVEYFSKDICGCGTFGIRIYGEPRKNEPASGEGAGK